MRPRDGFTFNETDSAHHNVITITGTSDVPGTALKTGDAEFDGFAIDFNASLDHLLTLFQATYIE